MASINNLFAAQHQTMKTTLAILLFSILASIVHGQRICGADTYNRQLLAANPLAKASLDKAEQKIQQELRRASRDTSANELISIPVVVHIIYKTPEQNITDAQVLSQLDALNMDFSALNADRTNTPQAFKNAAADVKIKFCLAQVDPQGKSTNGITRKNTTVDVFSAEDGMKFDLQGGTNAWDSKMYLNIWVCALTGRSLGYASLPGSEGDKDGVVIAFDAFGTRGKLRPVFNRGRTATHEVGHWLGLKHIWGDADCGDDLVDDTPAQQTYNFGCPSFPKMSACSPNVNGDMFMNYMDFSDDACMNMFTIGQKKRMRALFAAKGVRNTFLNSFACDSTLAQSGPTPTASPAIVKIAPGFKIYPNPVSSFLTIESTLAEFIQKETVVIYNATGKIVVSAELNRVKASLNVAALPAGFYIIQVGEGSSRFIGKFIKH